MEDTLAAINFADELMQHIAAVENVNYESSFQKVSVLKSSSVSHFDQEVGVAVSFLVGAVSEDIWQCYDELIKEKLIPSDEFFCQLSLQAAPLYFPDGYTHVNFIAYCAMIMGVSMCFLERQGLEGRDIESILTYASIAVSTVLNGFILSNEFQSGGGWDELVEVCILFNDICHQKKTQKNIDPPKKPRSGSKKKQDAGKN